MPLIGWFEAIFYYLVHSASDSRLGKFNKHKVMLSTSLYWAMFMSRTSSIVQCAQEVEERENQRFLSLS